MVSKMESDNMLIWVGTGIAQRRKHAGLSCSQLARKAGFKTEAMHRVEAGEHALSLRQLYAILRALGTTMREFFGSD